MGIIVSLTMTSLIMVSFFIWIFSELFFGSSCADAALVDKIIVKSNSAILNLVIDFFNLLAGFTKSSFSLLIIYYGIKQIFFPEIGPKRIGKIQFSISNLPQ